MCEGPLKLRDETLRKRRGRGRTHSLCGMRSSAGETTSATATASASAEALAERQSVKTFTTLTEHLKPQCTDRQTGM